MGQKKVNNSRLKITRKSISVLFTPSESCLTYLSQYETTHTPSAVSVSPLSFVFISVVVGVYFSFLIQQGLNIAFCVHGKSRLGETIMRG